MSSLRFTHDALSQRVVLDSGRVIERVLSEADQLEISGPAGNPAKVTVDNLTALLTAALNGDDPATLADPAAVTAH